MTKQEKIATLTLSSVRTSMEYKSTNVTRINIQFFFFLPDSSEASSHIYDYVYAQGEAR